MSSLIKIDHVSFSYQKDNWVLQNICLNIASGEFLGITGVNGSGKSTLIYLLNGLIPHLIKGKLTGKVYIEGEDSTSCDVAYFSKKVGLVFQNPDFSLFNLTVEEEIAFAINNLKLDKRRERIKKSLMLVGLTGFEKRDPQTLSMGEKQKVSLASVLALDCQCIVLDEPTEMLDYKSSLELYKILCLLKRNGKTIISVDHDTDFLYKYTDRVLLLDKGKIKALGKSKKILSNKKLLNYLGIKQPNI